MKVIIVLGATATGKTEIAFKIAEKLKCEIINFDSVQVFKKLNIGSAKPPKNILDKIPHHLLDVIEPDKNFTAGDFRREALKIFKILSVKHKYCVLVGGTGFYLGALLHGMFEVGEVDPQIKIKLIKELNEEGLEKLYLEMIERDPFLKNKIHNNDSYRILRALEVMRAGNKTLTEIKQDFQKEKFPYEYIQIGLRREKLVLKDAILKRSAKMVDEGLVDETLSLKKEYGNIRVLSSVGYKEAMALINGEILKEELVEKITSSTLKLVKRQITWFKRDKSINWFDPDKENLELMGFLDKTI